MNLVKNLIPQDTRSIELASAFGLLILALMMPIAIFLPENFTNSHPYTFWMIITGFLGGFQLYSLLVHPAHESMRTILSWMAGCFWLWMGLSDGFFRPTDIGAVLIGLSNLFAFLINLVLISEKWNQ